MRLPLIFVSVFLPIFLFCQTFRPSKGVYRIPYADATEVYVTNDHQIHSPGNRIDMSGINGSNYNIVAAADGWIRFIVDSNTDFQGACANNNYVWIEHPNGEWTKYSHLATNSATVAAGLSVGAFVTQGTFLGIEGDIGCASGPHLHFECAIPTDPLNPIIPSDGYIIGENCMPIICGIPGNVFNAGDSYTANACISDCATGLVIAGGNIGAQAYAVRMADVSISTVGGNSVIFQNQSTGAFRAGDRIILRAGFEARSGCSFYAAIRKLQFGPVT